MPGKKSQAASEEGEEMKLVQDPATVKAEMERLELWKTFERTGKLVRFACNPVTREIFYHQVRHKLGGDDIPELFAWWQCETADEYGGIMAELARRGGLATSSLVIFDEPERFYRH